MTDDYIDWVIDKQIEESIIELDQEPLLNMRIHPNTRLDVRCDSAQWENTTTDAERAVDLAYIISEEHGADVELYYNSTGQHYMTVSNYRGHS